VNGIGRRIAEPEGIGDSRSRRSLLLRSDGFTIVELGVTLAVVSIIAVIAVTTFGTILRRNRITAAAREFVASANLARSEAIRRGSRVTLCSSSNGSSYTAGNWDPGWIVFADADGDGTVDAGDEILQVHRALGGGTTMQGPPDTITFTSRGVPAAGGTLTVASSVNAGRTVSIVLGTTGRLTMTTIGY